MWSCVNHSAIDQPEMDCQTFSGSLPLAAFQDEHSFMNMLWKYATIQFTKIKRENIDHLQDPHAKHLKKFSTSNSVVVDANDNKKEIKRKSVWIQ